MRKSAIERYNDMDEKSSEEEWNDDFGLIVIEVFETAVRQGQLNKTVRKLIAEIETRVKDGSR
jgi:hypothetical protein